MIFPYLKAEDIFVTVSPDHVFVFNSDICVIFKVISSYLTTGVEEKSPDGPQSETVSFT